MCAVFKKHVASGLSVTDGAEYVTVGSSRLDLPAPHEPNRFTKTTWRFEIYIAMSILQAAARGPLRSEPRQ